MLFNVLPSLAALASFAIAAPTPSQTSLDTPLDAPVDIKARAADPPGGPITCYGGPPCITDGGEGSACIISQWVTKGAAHAWVVGIPGDTLSNYGEGSSTLGGGLLDNLRGQCGVITDWEAASDDSDNLLAKFSTTIFCGSDDVHNAIWLANGKNYEANCVYEDPTKVTWASGVTAALQSLMEIINVVVPRT